MEEVLKYPVGQQSFEVLRSEGYLYVDKTMFVQKLINTGQYFFLGRPRRFGKSLFLSMLKSFYEGRKDLFKGLYAETMNWKWESYPVLMLDINIDKYKTETSLAEVLNNSLLLWEKEYDVEKTTENLSIRFSNVIRGAYLKTGKRVVILIDEYDKPIVNNLHDELLADLFRDELGAFYSNLKSSADYIHLVFLTGVSRFSKLSVFSGLNNINDISFNVTFNDICGITEEELHDYFECPIQELADAYNMSCREIVALLKKRYDGYRFTVSGKEMYNPFSILNVMANKEFGNYWVESGHPTLLIEQLKYHNTDLDDLLHTECALDDLKGLDLETSIPEALFYQTGYLTIKTYDKATKLVSLGLPNEEVKEGFFRFLLPYYVNLQGKSSQFFITKFVSEFNKGDVDGFMSRMQSMFSKMTYRLNMDDEKNIRNVFYMLITLLGQYVQAELETSEGRIDLFVSTRKFYYIIELKLDGFAHKALRQINEKNYSLPFRYDGKKVIKIGVNFSRKRRTIENWNVE